MSHPSDRWMQEAIDLARTNMEQGGRPFGAVLVRGNEVLAREVNTIHRTGDPTAHAELLALRTAGLDAKNADLSGTVMYASGHPCPMCMAAMHLAGVERVYFAYDNVEGAAHGLSTAHIYQEMQKDPLKQSLPMEQFQPKDAPNLYASWAKAVQT